MQPLGMHYAIILHRDDLRDRKKLVNEAKRKRAAKPVLARPGLRWILAQAVRTLAVRFATSVLATFRPEWPSLPYRQPGAQCATADHPAQGRPGRR